MVQSLFFTWYFIKHSSCVGLEDLFINEEEAARLMNAMEPEPVPHRTTREQVEPKSVNVEMTLKEVVNWQN